MRIPSRRGPLSLLALAAPLLLSYACSSTPVLNVDSDSDSGSDADSGNGGADSGADSGSDLGSDSDIGGIDSGNGGAGPRPGNGKPEICDGIDNNDDGFVDNIDVGNDGICDCLNIGTIGRIGPWSTGGDIFKTWLNERSPIPAKEIADKELTTEELRGLDVIVVLRADTAALGKDSSPAHHEFATSEINALDAWVRAGGGLMTTIGYQTDENPEALNVNRLLGAFDLGYESPSADVTGFIENWEVHPISAGVERVRTDNGSQPRDANGTVVARNGEQIAMVVDQVEDGRVIVFGDEWITYDSEWVAVDDQQIERLWLNMIKWMSPPQRCQVPIPTDVK